MRRGERSLLGLPPVLLVGFVVLLVIQISVHHLRGAQFTSAYRPLSRPFSAPVYAGISMGSEQLMSYLLVMRLQLHDNQAGRHVRYNFIDYAMLIEWLQQIGQINPVSEYSMMLASRVYSQTRDKPRLRILLEYIDQTFLANPQLHWRRQAEATVIAKHQLGDLELALQMAEKLSVQPGSVEMPRWARDMHFLLLGDLNEFETAIVIIRALLEGGNITDRDEVRFLREKLLYFQQKLSEFELKG